MIGPDFAMVGLPGTIIRGGSSSLGGCIGKALQGFDGGIES